MNDLTTLLVKLPRNEEVSPESVKTFLSSLVGIEKAGKFARLTGGKSKRLSLEIAVIQTQIHFLVTTETDLISFVETQLQSNYPKVIISKFDEPLAAIKQELHISYLKLKKGTNYPLSTYDKFKDVDPLASVLTVLSKSSEDEFSMIQFALESADSSWQGKALSYAEQGKKNEDGSYSPRPDADVIKEKASVAGFRSTIRLASTNPLRLNEIGRSFGVFARSDGNSFSVNTPGRFRAGKESDQLKNREVADSQILNITELATLWHLPGENIKTPSIVTGQKVLSEAPQNLPVGQDQAESVKQEINFFARTQFKNKDMTFGIKTQDRLKHIWTVGKTGTGKSTLIANMAIDDLRKGRGLTVIDPHGDLCEDLLDYIPSSRINDTIYFNPADRDFPISINPLEVTNREEAELVVAGLMSIFTKVWANVWSARMEYILRNSFLTLSEIPETTLFDVLKLLSDATFRTKILTKVSDETLLHFWRDEFEQMPEQFQKEAVSPLQNKVGQFVTSPMIRRIIDTPRSSISIRDIMDEKKILLVNLSQGRLGEDNAALLGAMLITKFQLAAMHRVDVSKEHRTPHYLYVDEFQNFATNSFIKILSEARKYGLALTLANQYMAQIPEEVTKAILGNAGTIVTFAAGADDAAVVHKEFAETFSQNDLVNLEKFQIAIKLMIDGHSTKPFLATTLPLPKGKNQNRDKVVRVSRERWATKAKPRPQVQVEEVKTPPQNLQAQAASTQAQIPDPGDEASMPTTQHPVPNMGDKATPPTIQPQIPISQEPNPSKPTANDSLPKTEPARFKVVTDEPIDPTKVSFDPGRSQRTQPQAQNLSSQAHTPGSG
ncbi:type IV secretion system DNA-binding domain-containing protein, partial [Patescibacteria group bacterium]